MAINLARAGQRVAGFDLSATSLQRFGEVGVAVADTIADAVADAELVKTMLPAGEPARSIFERLSGLGLGASDSSVIARALIEGQLSR